jgi:RNA polymerase sigma factor (sigma-70 family)
VPATSPPPTADPSLVESFHQIRYGEPDATNRFSAQCHPLLANYARKRGSSDPDGIADLALVELLSKVEELEFESSEQIWAYLFAVARLRVLREFESKQRNKAEPLSTNLVADDRRINLEADVVDRLLVEDTLAQLTPDQAEILTLRFLDDLTIAQTAAKTGRTETAVKALQRRALRSSAALLAGALAVALAYFTWSNLRDNSSSLRTDPAVPTTSTTTSPEIGGPDGPVNDIGGSDEQPDDVTQRQAERLGDSDSSADTDADLDNGDGSGPTADSGQDGGEATPTGSITAGSILGTGPIVTTTVGAVDEAGGSQENDSQDRGFFVESTAVPTSTIPNNSTTVRPSTTIATTARSITTTTPSTILTTTTTTDDQLIGGTVVAPSDYDNDGRPDAVDLDDDNDGLSDAVESQLSLDRLNPDTDGDGIQDGTELGITSPSADSVGGTRTFRPDTDPGSVTDPTDPDSDDDGVCDGSRSVGGVCTGGEDKNNDGAVSQTIGGTGTSGTGETDPTRADTDGDGLSDGRELFIIGTDPLDTDTDDGTVDDRSELDNGTNPISAPGDDVPAAPNTARITGSSRVDEYRANLDGLGAKQESYRIELDEPADSTTTFTIATADITAFRTSNPGAPYQYVGYGSTAAAQGHDFSNEDPWDYTISKNGETQTGAITLTVPAGSTVSQDSFEIDAWMEITWYGPFAEDYNTVFEDLERFRLTVSRATGTSQAYTFTSREIQIFDNGDLYFLGIG